MANRGSGRRQYIIIGLILVVTIAGINLIYNRLSYKSNELEFHKIVDISRYMKPPDRRDISYSGSGCVSWEPNNLQEIKIIACEVDTAGDLARNILAFNDSGPIAALAAGIDDIKYKFFKGVIKRKSRFLATAWSNRSDYRINHFAMEMPDGRIDFAIDQNGNGETDFFITQSSESELVILVLDENKESSGSTILYDINHSCPVAMAFYSETESEIRDLFVRQDEDCWVEYILADNKNKSQGIALHDSIPGIMRGALFDLDGDSIAKVLLSQSEFTSDSLVTFPFEKNISQSIEEGYSLARLVIPKIQMAGNRWKECSETVIDFGILGKTLPNIYSLPFKATE